jgi:hypothetical protein
VEGESVRLKFGVTDYTARYSQHYEFDGEGLGNMERKTSATMNSDARKLGDDLDYQLDYEYEGGYAHRVKRIGEAGIEEEIDIPYRFTGKERESARDGRNI